MNNSVELNNKSAAAGQRILARQVKAFLTLRDLKGQNKRQKSQNQKAMDNILSLIYDELCFEGIEIFAKEEILSKLMAMRNTDFLAEQVASALWTERETVFDIAAELCPVA